MKISPLDFIKSVIKNIVNKLGKFIQLTKETFIRLNV